VAGDAVAGGVGTTLRKIAPGVWVVERPLPLVVGDIGARMTIVR
jgi:hypothetical protein